MGGEVLREQRVENAERPGVGDEARHLHDALHPAAGVLQHRSQVRERLARLRFERVARDLARHRIDARLAGREHQRADAHGLGVRADARHTRAVDDFLGEGHAGSGVMGDDERGHASPPTVVEREIRGEPDIRVVAARGR